jgi:hypothetical protein
MTGMKKLLIASSFGLPNFGSFILPSPVFLDRLPA